VTRSGWTRGGIIKAETGRAPTPGAIDMGILRLRRLLWKRGSKSPKLIETKRGRGARFRLRTGAAGTGQHAPAA
jgi:DNA-binding response OmpR family regulator